MTLVYSKWAVPLLDTINADIANTSAQASSLLTPIVYEADLFEDEAKFLAGNFGFDGYMGVPGLMAPMENRSLLNSMWHGRPLNRR